MRAKLLVTHSLLSLLTLSLTTLPLGAQDSLPAQLNQLKPNLRIKVLITGGERLQGTLVGVGGIPPTLHFESRADGIPVATIDSLWIRRSRAGKGAWIGALALGVPSAIFWTNVCNFVAEGGGCDAFDVVGALTLAGAGVGAGAGALIGSASHHWVLRYARARTTPLERPGQSGRRVDLGLRVAWP